MSYASLLHFRVAKKKKHYFIDLFAGCGGLSLGLEKARFTPLLFSELNPSASSTYKANRDEHDFLSVDEFIAQDAKDLIKKEPIIEAGDIIADLTDEKLKGIIKQHRAIDPNFEVDLVCGGPPCQGYSMINHRRAEEESHLNNNKQDIPSNFLFKEMIRVIEAFKPKIFLFENVEGIRRSHWKIDGKTSRIFDDVMEEFRKVCGSGYNVEDASIHSRDYSVPQRRPRTLIAGIRKDISVAPGPSTEGNHCDDGQIDFSDDLVKVGAIARGFLPPAIDIPQPPWPNLSDVLDDLIDPYDQVEDLVARDKGKSSPRRYPINKVRGQKYTQMQKWYRATKDEWFGRNRKSHLKYLKQVTDHEYSRHGKKTIHRFKIIMENNGEIPPEHEELKTNKFAQRLLRPEWLDESGPNITVTSLPDDFVHYEQPRILTVREWARLQTFPDWYVFRGPRTTGGRRRAGTPSKDDWEREVPRYTQIGNAVPVRLAYEIGKHFRKIV